MKYKTKRERLVAICDAYAKVAGKTHYTMAEVATWALSKNLSPVPKRGASLAECAVWESILDEAVANRK